LIRGFLTAAIATVALASQSPAQEKQAEPELLPGIPTSALPPDGMCRVWLKDVPVGRQPAPTDCASAIKSRPRDAILLIGEPGKNAKGPARSPVNAMTRGQSEDLFNRRRGNASSNLLPAERAELQNQRTNVAQRAGQPATSGQQAPAGGTAAVKAPDQKAAVVVKPPE
jgi:hypothetical protein